MLCLAAAALVNALFFQWIHLVVVRFSHAAPDIELFLSQIMIVFSATICLILIVMGIGSTVIPHSSIFFLVFMLSLSQSLFDLSLFISSAQFKIRIYGLMSMLKVALSLSLGTVVGLAGFGGEMLVLSLVAANIIGALAFAPYIWARVSLSPPPWIILKDWAAYGFAAAVTFGLNWVLVFADRIMIGYFLSTAEVAIYGVVADITIQSLGVALMVVTTAAVPLIVRAFETEGSSAARSQLSVLADVVLSIAMVAAVLFLLLHRPIVDAVLGPEYRDGAYALMPIIALAGLINGVKVHVVECALQVAKRVKHTAAIGACVAMVNVVLNAFLIKEYGVNGAAWATVASLALGLVTSWWFARRIAPLPHLWASIARAGFLSLTAALGIYIAPDLEAPVASLLVNIMVAFISCGIGAYVLDVGRLRSQWLPNLRRRRT